MAKTISQMATEAYLKTLSVDKGDFRLGYVKGANAVLEKVEEVLNLKENQLGKLGRIALLDLLVYELKG